MTESIETPEERKEIARKLLPLVKRAFGLFDIIEKRHADIDMSSERYDFRCLQRSIFKELRKSDRA